MASMTLASPPVGGDQNRGPALLAITWLFTGLASLIVSFRLFSRVKILKETAIDDGFIILSLVLILICTSVISASVSAGMGRHEYYLTPYQRIQATKLNYIANPFGIMAYSFPNLSVAIFLNRILRLPRLQKSLIYSVPIAQCVIAGIACVLLFTQCTPTKFLWDPETPAKCLSAKVLTGYSYFVGAYSAFTDVFLAMIPAFAFRNLQMKTRVKFGLCLLMGTTAFAAICAIVKTSKLNELADLADFTYASVDLLIWAVIEADVIIIAACIPSLRPFASAMGQSLRDRKSRSRPKRTWYQQHSSGTPLALIPGRVGSAFNNSTERTSHTSSTPSQGVRKTTEIVLERD